MTANPLVTALEEAVERAREMDAPLNERLGLIADTVRSLSTEFAAAVDRLIARLRASGAGESAPAPGERMPDFALPDETGRLVTLGDVLAEGPVAVSFNRGHWCPYCRLNAVAMAEVEKEVAEAGGRIVAIVPEKRKFTNALKEDAAAPFPVLTDLDNGYALSLNLAIWVGEEMEKMIAAAGWDLPRYQGNDAWMLPIPATFVVGTDGVIVARYMDPDYRKRMEIDQLLAALRAACKPMPEAAA
jgi:peroxiredoxin